MFADQPVVFTLVANGTVTKNLIAQGSGQNGNQPLGALGTGGTQNLLGVTASEANSGEFFSVAAAGVARLTMAGSCAAYTRVTATTGGKGTAAASGNNVVGILLDPATADGDTVRCLLTLVGDKTSS